MEQRQRVVNELRAMGARVIKVFMETCSGKLGYANENGLTKPYTAVRTRAARYALRNDAVLVAESVSRYLRSDFYQKDRQDVRPSCDEWEELKFRTLDVPLYTLEVPSIRPDAERKIQTLRGLEAKRPYAKRRKPKKPGYMKERREALLPVVMELRKAGNSMRIIAKRTGVPFTTINDWLKRC